MTNCVIVGVNWGDEGKGRMVDLLTEDFDIVVRYQGGGNAGHTVINEYGKFALHLLPSGIFRRNVVNVLGNGIALDPENLLREIEEVRAKGIEVTPENLKISERASVLMPWHRLLDGLEENRLKDRKYGSTKQGIAPFYSDKYQKKTFLAGEILYPEKCMEHMKDLLAWKNMTIENVYHASPVTESDLQSYADSFFEKLKPFICNTTEYLAAAEKEGKRILFEAQLGALRDIDYGIYPFTSSSNPIAAYAPVGCGCPNLKVDEVVGVTKAYSTCVGEGPFVGELDGQDAHDLREAGGEYGAATGRPRRVAWFDVPATLYGTKLQGATSLALTKIDVLSYLKEIPVCVAYKLNGEETTRFPFTADLDDCEPVYEVLPGWNCDVSKCRSWDELPKAAQDYVLFLEKKIGCPIQYVSVGPEREALIIR